MRNNQSATRAICKAICNTCYVDTDVLEEMLAVKGIDPEASVNDERYAELVEVAIKIVIGWVETSRSEGGISTSIAPDRITNSIMVWCGEWGLDADELLSNSAKVLKDGSNLW